MKKLLLLILFGLSLYTTQAQDTIQIGTGTASSVLSPFQFGSAFNCTGILCFSNSIGRSGTIVGIAYQRSASDLNLVLDGCKIRLKHTTETLFDAGQIYDTTGYTTVFQGNMPNTTANGWEYITLQTPFVYNGVDNLDILNSRENGTQYGNSVVTHRYSSGSGRIRRVTGTTTTALVSGTTVYATTSFITNVVLIFQSATGLEARLVGNGLQVHQFAGSTKFSVKITGKSDGKVSLVNTTGQVVKHFDASEAQTDYDLADLSAGIYFVKATVNGEVVTRRVVR